MGLRLSVQRDAWKRSVEGAAGERSHLIPVVKGNGYGFGRPALMPFAASLSSNGWIGVGTVYEAHDVPADRTPLVLTPHVGALPPTLPHAAVLTIGRTEHVDSLVRDRWRGTVVVKLASSMRRYGVDPRGVAELAAAVRDAGLSIGGFSLHLPLSGTDESRAAEVTAWLLDERVDPSLPLSVSHLGPLAYRSLAAAHPTRQLQIRCGTALWHADKRTVQLTADVLDVRPVRGGTTAGYRAAEVPGPGHIVLAAAGSAHGVRALDGGLSPFHFSRQRVTLLEPPHMHTSMLFVPDGQPVPARGDRIDVQRPLIETIIDELEWIDAEEPADD